MLSTSIRVVDAILRTLVKPNDTQKRFCEHQGRSPLTGKVIHGQCSTPVREHMLSCDTTVAFSDFSILSRDDNSKALSIKESLFIRRDCPTLNIQGQSYPLKLFL